MARSVNDIQLAQGWDDSTLFNLAINYIVAHGHLGDFITTLEERAEIENAFTEEIDDE